MHETVDVLFCIDVGSDSLYACAPVLSPPLSRSFTQSRPAEFRVVYAAPTKMALIIGNSDYHHLEKLPVVHLGWG